MGSVYLICQHLPPDVWALMWHGSSDDTQNYTSSSLTPGMFYQIVKVCLMKADNWSSTLRVGMWSQKPHPIKKEHHLQKMMQEKSVRERKLTRKLNP